MFLWVKSAPGGAEKIVPSETRESLHPRNKNSGCCPFVARSFNKLGLEEFATAERNTWFPSHRYSISGNMTAVSFKGRTFWTVVPFPLLSVELPSLASAWDGGDGVGSEKTGVTAEEKTNRTGVKSFMNMIVVMGR
jgi:hypothetical protein